MLQSQTIAFYLRELAAIQLELATMLEAYGNTNHTLTKTRGLLKLGEQLRTAHINVAECKYREAQQIIERIRRELDLLSVKTF
jgi:hypothetical protein